MPRIRSIHPEALESEKLLRLSDGAERTFWRLTTYSDDAGRGVDNPKLLASRLYPLDDDRDDEVVDAHLDELVEAGLLLRYSVAGKAYYEMHDFQDWQKPRHPTPSKFPACPEDYGPPTADCRNATADGGSPTDKRANTPHGGGGVVGVGDVVGTPAEPSVPPDKPAATQRAAPKRARHPDWQPNESHQAKARELGLDVDDEAERFKLSHDSKGNRFADWDMAFHNWLRNAPKFAGPRSHLRAVGESQAELEHRLMQPGGIKVRP